MSLSNLMGLNFMIWIFGLFKKGKPVTLKNFVKFTLHLLECEWITLLIKEESPYCCDLPFTEKQWNVSGHLFNPQKSQLHSSSSSFYSSSSSSAAQSTLILHTHSRRENLDYSWPWLEALFMPKTPEPNVWRQARPTFQRKNMEEPQE